MINSKTRMSLSGRVWWAATVLGYARKRTGDTFRKHSQDRGSRINIINDIQGVLGELICIHKAESDTECGPVYHDITDFSGPVDDVDLKVTRKGFEFRIEAKALFWEEYKNLFLIDKTAHSKSLRRRATGYIPIITAFGSTVAYIGDIIQPDELDSWGEFNGKNGSVAFSCTLPTIARNHLSKSWVVVSNDIHSHIQFERDIESLLEFLDEEFEAIRPALEDFPEYTTAKELVDNIYTILAEPRGVLE